MPSSSPASSSASTSTAVSSSGVAGSSASEATEKKKRTKTVMGVIEPEQQTDGPDQPPHPAAAGAVEEQRGQKLVAEDHHQHHGENGLRDLGIGGPGQMRSAIEEHRAEFQRDDAQGQLLQHRRADGRVLAAQAQLRLDQLLPGVQVFLFLAGENLAELGVDAADVARPASPPRRGRR